MTWPVAELMTAVQAAVTSTVASISWEHDSNEAVYVHGAPPRVVWYPLAIDFAAGALQSPLPTTQVAAVATGMQRIRVHCWGLTRGDAWEIGRAVLEAVHRVVGSAVVPVSGEWVRGGEGQTLHHGYVLALELDVAAQVQATPPTVVQIDDVGHESYMTGSSELGCGEVVAP